MIIKEYKVDEHSVFTIDNWYTETEYTNAYEECKFLINNYSTSPEYSGSATDELTQEILKKNKAVFLQNVYLNMLNSPIGKRVNKLFNNDLKAKLESYNSFYWYLNHINNGSALISYYEEKDYYKSHRDIALITQLIWLYEEPKMFSGGNFYLRDKNHNIVHEIECISNRSVIMPSFISHEVEPVDMKEEDMNQSKGRYTISLFNYLHLSDMNNST